MTRLPAVGFRRQAPHAALIACSIVALVACTSLVTTDPPRASDPPTPVMASQRPGPSPTHTPVQTQGFQVSHVQSEARWASAITSTIGGRDVSVAVGTGRRIVYAHLGDVPRVLASNEKLLTSMAALDLLGSAFRFTTQAAAVSKPANGVVRGDLWLVGGGDPTLTPGDLAVLASAVRHQGITRVTGDVIGDTSAFDRGWWAPGWLQGISRMYVTRPTALRLDGGDSSPEPEAAASFRDALASAGVHVDGVARTGAAPRGLEPIASERSPVLSSLLVQQNHESDNLYAELTTKYLGGLDGNASTASGAAVVERWVRELGVTSEVRDGSGLSDQDETSAVGMVTLLLAARQERWFPALERSLPSGGDGTLGSRLAGLPVRAKTGTLFIRPASTLSGYVTTRAGTLVAFSVLTHDLPEGTAVAIEDSIVRTIAVASIR